MVIYYSVSISWCLSLFVPIDDIRAVMPLMEYLDCIPICIIDFQTQQKSEGISTLDNHWTMGLVLDLNTVIGLKFRYIGHMRLFRTVARERVPYIYSWKGAYP